MGVQVIVDNIQNNFLEFPLLLPLMKKRDSWRRSQSTLPFNTLPFVHIKQTARLSDWALELVPVWFY